MPNDSPVSSPAPLLFGKYDVLEKLGSGQFAEVFHVKNARTGHDYAVKVAKAPDLVQVERMYQEGQIQAQLVHPHIVRVIEVVQKDREVGLVMEYIEGPSLRELIDPSTPYDLVDALMLFKQIMAGVAAAHRAGVLHRDLKPENVLLAESGDDVIAKIIDFGLAKPIAGQVDESFTQVGTTMGAPGYAPPEQLRDASSVGKEADVFALGVVLYELLSGQPAYGRGADIPATLRATVEGDCKPIKTLVSGIQADVARAIHKAIDPDPAKRFPTVEAFAMAIYGEPLENTPGPVRLTIERTGSIEDLTGTRRKGGGSKKPDATEPPKAKATSRLDDGNREIYSYGEAAPVGPSPSRTALIISAVVAALVAGAATALAMHWMH